MNGWKRNCVTIVEKSYILEVVKESGKKKRVDISKELEIAPSTLKSIMAKAAKIEKVLLFVVSSNKQTHIQGGKYERLKDCMLQWFQQHRAEETPISGLVLCEKANEPYDCMRCSAVISNTYCFIKNE